jgi:hypothetical protein
MGMHKGKDNAHIVEARARVLDAYAAVCRERDEWAQLKDAIGRDLGDALGRVQELTDEVEGYRKALEFYADPDTYFACGFAFDPPCGDFPTDFCEEHGADYTTRPLPGMRARAALSGEAHE